MNFITAGVYILKSAYCLSGNVCIVLHNSPYIKSGDIPLKSLKENIKPSLYLSSLEDLRIDFGDYTYVILM